MSTESAALARRWFEEVWNKGRVEAIDELMSAESVVHGLGEDLHGPEGFKAFHASYRDAFPDVRLNVDEVLAADDLVAVRWSGTGTHQGNGLGYAATGKQVTFRGMSFLRVENGKFTEGWNSFDQLGMMQQLGVV